MNVFEDLVLELKEDNLLESTVIDGLGAEDPSTDVLLAKDIEVPESRVMPVTAAITPAPKIEAPKKAENGLEFFKKKAIGEVSSLQMVEGVITGVEREYMKVVPRAFDDLNAKKALNAFVNSEASARSEEHKTAEFELMTETESWCSALADRDREVPVTLLRQYCERSRPALSSQALLGLGRFYRNLPYSEPVRSKFDFVITRLFSRPVDKEKRICLFDRSEMLTHINTLYSDWSSISLYSVDEDDTDVTLTAMSFDELAAEAESAAAFDELIESDFFGRLRMFKESISDLFYAPEVTCAAISANIRIGNAYVDLIERERTNSNSESLRDRYAEHDNAISETTGKTLQLAKLLKHLEAGQAKAETAARREVDVTDEPPPRRAPAAKKRAPAPATVAPSYLTGMKGGALAVNKWVLVFAAVMISAAAGFYVWAGNTPDENVKTAGVKVFELDNPALKEHLKSARISGDTMYAQVQPSWDALSREARQELLQKVYQAAAENGCKRVSLFGNAGKSVGYAAAGRVEVASP